MKVIIDDYVHLFMKNHNFHELDKYENSFFKNNIDWKSLSNTENMFMINWGENIPAIHHASIETGFFWDAIHLDTRGLYNFSSFNFSDFRDELDKFSCDVTAKELFAKGKLKQKLSQPKDNIEWDGIVGICQYPNDRSIHKAGSSKDYYTYIEDLCRFFGKRLFLKMHPTNNDSEKDMLWSICKKYDVDLGKVHTDSFNNCELAYVYNSTILPDFLVRKVPVLQYAPGYFWKSGAVSYTDRKITTDFENDINYNYKFCDFLLWKYCFHKKMSLEQINNIFHIFANSNETFPLPKELSYAQYLINQS